MYEILSIRSELMIKKENKKTSVQLIFKVKSFLKQELSMDDYWQESGQTVTIQQSYQPPQQHVTHNDQEQFDFSATQNTYDSTALNHSYTSTPIANYSSSLTTQQQDEITRQIREQEERINQMLQEKANNEYALKQKRKEQGRRWLEEFFNKKQQQTQQKKEQNVRHEQQLLHDMKHAQTAQGWTKVAKSVDLKLSDYKGSKDINRMREAIQHKREDEVNV